MNVAKQYDNNSSLSDVNTNNNNDNMDIVSTQRDINALGSTCKTGAKRNNALSDALIYFAVYRFRFVAAKFVPVNSSRRNCAIEAQRIRTSMPIVRRANLYPVREGLRAVSRICFRLN